MENIGINNRKSLCRPKVIKLQAIFLPTNHFETPSPTPSLFLSLLPTFTLFPPLICLSFFLLYSTTSSTFSSLFHFSSSTTFSPFSRFHFTPTLTPFVSVSSSRSFFFAILPLCFKNICKAAHFFLHLSL